MNTEQKKLNAWIALNVTRTLRRLTDAEYAAVVTWCEEANEYPHPNLSLTQPYRYEGMLPQDASDPAAAMQVLKICMEQLDILTGRTDWQIVVLFDEGSDKPYVVTTDSSHDSDDDAHVRNCASAETMELAICRFCKNLHARKRVAEPSNAPLEPSGANDNRKTK